MVEYILFRIRSVFTYSGATDVFYYFTKETIKVIETWSVNCPGGEK